MAISTTVTLECVRCLRAHRIQRKHTAFGKYQQRKMPLVIYQQLNAVGSDFMLNTIKFSERRS